MQYSSRNLQTLPDAVLSASWHPAACFSSATPPRITPISLPNSAGATKVGYPLSDPDPLRGLSRRLSMFEILLTLYPSAIRQAHRVPFLLHRLRIR